MRRVIEHQCFTAALNRVGARGRLARLRTVIRWTTGGIIAVGLLLLSAGIVLAAAPGTWSTTTSMHTARSGALSVLLGTGKVLVTGGNSDTDVSAEVYDPVTAKWSPTGSALFPPATFRSPVFATLPNGRVLVMSGVDGRSAQLYDPATGRWSRTASALVAPGTLTLLPDGRVLGVGTTDTGSRRAELYDPSTGGWKWTTSPVTVEAQGENGNSPAIAALLLSGQVLVLSVNEAFWTSDAKLYDPATATWRATGSPSDFVSGPAAVLPSGKVLVAGQLHIGGSSFFRNGVAAIYDPSKGTWAAAASAGGFPNSLTLLGDGRVLAAGEDSSCAFCDPATAHSNKAEVFEPLAGTWSTTGALVDGQGRPGHTATLLPNGTVLAAGGNSFVPSPTGNSTFAPTSSAERYTPPTTAALPTDCKVSRRGIDAAGHAVVWVAVRDIASGLQSIKVLQATNVSVALPKFPPASRDPQIVSATKINASHPSGLTLSVRTGAGNTVTCHAF